MSRLTHCCSTAVVDAASKAACCASHQRCVLSEHTLVIRDDRTTSDTVIAFHAANRWRSSVAKGAGSAPRRRLLCKQTLIATRDGGYEERSQTQHARCQAHRRCNAGRGGSGERRAADTPGTRYESKARGAHRPGHEVLLCSINCACGEAMVNPEHPFHRHRAAATPLPHTRAEPL